MKAIVSLLGPSGSGKSTLAEGLTERLHANGLSTTTIKKDDAIRSLSRERFGREWIGYSPLRAVLPGRFNESDLHDRINSKLVEADQDGVDIAILEGGTRTPSAQAETLRGLEAVPFSLIVLDIPIKEIRRRLIHRRQTADRQDDNLLLMGGKLIGQYTKTLGAKAHTAAEGNIVVNAVLPPDVVASDAYSQIAARLRPEA